MNWGVRLASVFGTIGLLFLADFVCSTFIDDYVVRLILLAGLYVTLSVSLNLINGITGQFSIGHAGFYMIGAYTALLISNAVYAKQPLGPAVWLIVTAILGAVVAGIFGFIVGLPSLRLKGDYLAIVTLGFGEIIRIIAINQQEWGGSTGDNIEPKAQFVWLIWLLAILCIAVCRNLLKSAHGLPFLAVREDEVAAQAMGVNLTRTKVTAFVIGSAFAGAAGAMFAHLNGFISPDMFKMEVSFLILTMVVLGGTGSITGSTVAALMLFAIPEMSRILKISVSLGSVLGAGVALVAIVWLVKAYIDSRLPQSLRKPALIPVGIVAGVALGWIAGVAFNLVPQFSETTYDATQLRMVFLAVTLLVVMLIRPQGIFGYHEFSWDIFKKKRKSEGTLGGVA